MARTRAAKPATTETTDAAHAASGDSTLDLSTLTRAQLGAFIDTTDQYLEIQDRLGGYIGTTDADTRAKAEAFAVAARTELASRPSDTESETW